MLRQMTRRCLCGILAAVLFAVTLFAATPPAITAWAKPDWPSDVAIEAEAGIAMDVDSGTVLIGQSIHVPYAPASITKLLTALIVLENCELDETVVYSETAINSVEADSGNKLSLRAGDEISVEDALYALLLVSSNQSANALAEHVAGSISAFVDRMNEKLVELGCEESHFDNPSGLNGDTQYVTAYDMAIIACAAFQNEALLEISSAITWAFPPTIQFPDGQTIHNEHRLVYTTDETSPYYCPAAVAGKTGYLLKAGNTLVTYGEQDGRRVVSVILKGQSRQYFIDGKTLLEFGLNRFKNLEIADYEKNYMEGNDTITLGGTRYRPSDLVIESGRPLTLPNDAEFADAEFNLIEELPDGHPSAAVGLLRYIYNERKIGEAYLLTRASEVAVTEKETAIPEETAEAAPAAAPITESETAPTNPAPIAAIAITLVIIAAAAGAIYRITRRRRLEAEALARRRERRRQRLAESGDSEEFEQLLKERLEKKKERIGNQLITDN